VLDAMAYCHRHNVAHRDLKLDNLLLDADNPPALKIADFGFAKLWGNEDASCYTLIGTPVYMAPQVGRFKTNVASTVLVIVMYASTWLVTWV
jgi:serine/threonine-protein kinase SRK2